MSSYPSIYALGHGAVKDLLKTPVIVEEKVDGSQFTFFKAADGELRCRSKGADVNTFAPEGMFKQAVENLLAMKDRIPSGLTFRGEYLAKTKHNVLCYARVPVHNIILFDIQPGEESYLSPAEKRAIATDLGFEVVPMLHHGMIESPDQVREFLDRESCLGGPKIEGVVIKPAAYDLFGRDKKVLMGKFVSETFKETHKKEWKADDDKADIFALIANSVCSPARWEKAIQHLREAGKLEDSPRDIGPLMAEIPKDTEKEESDWVKEKLYAWAWPRIKRLTTRGFPEWYKDRLLKQQFQPDDVARVLTENPNALPL